MSKRMIALCVILSFILGYYQPVYAQLVLDGTKFSVNELPVPGQMVGVSTPFAPLALKGLVINPRRPLEFQFIIDTGRGPQDPSFIKEEASHLVKYFLAGLTIPEGDLWVNLSPYEKSRIIPDALGQTELGRDLLAQDYILKQLTASLIYPEKDLGKEFWSSVYQKAQEQYGTTNIPVNTFNKVWILPDEARVFENKSAVYVTKATLKVMLDEDYLAKQRNQHTESSSIASQMVRTIILPAIKKEVNTGSNFSSLRQIYDAMILAKWYKETIQNGLLDAIYTNKKKTAGVAITDPAIKEKIYQRYLQAYKKGVFNYIKEDMSSDGQEMPRKYFSGGTFLGKIPLHKEDAMPAVRADGAMAILDIVLNRIGVVRKDISDQYIIDFVRNKSERTVRQKENNPQAKTPMQFSFYGVKRFRKGRLMIQLNPPRKGRRPSQYTGNGIFQPVDPKAFNYNKIDKNAQLIGMKNIAGMPVSIITNVSPFAEGQHLLVPRMKENLPQYLDRQEFIRMALEQMAQSKHSNYKIGYNSLGAFSTINHLHFHGFYYGGDQPGQELWNDGQLPVEDGDRQELFSQNGVKVSRIKQADSPQEGSYPARGMVFNSQDGNLDHLSAVVFDYVKVLNQQKIAYNILFTKQGVIVMPRKYQFPNRFASGSAVLEMSGEFILFDEENIANITEEDMWEELKDTTIPEEQFEATLPMMTINADPRTPPDLGNTVSVGLNNTQTKANMQAMGQEAARRTIKAIKEIQASGRVPVIGVGTGTTVGSVYAPLVEAFRNDPSQDLSNVIFLAQDEYVGLGADHEQSYRRFIMENLIEPLEAIDRERRSRDSSYKNHAITRENFISFNGKAASPEDEIKRMVKEIRRRGGIDFQVLAGGLDGHFAFVFPAVEIAERESFDSEPMRNNFRDRNEIVITKNGLAVSELKEWVDEIVRIRHEQRETLGGQDDEVVQEAVKRRREHFDMMLKKAIEEGNEGQEAFWREKINGDEGKLRGEVQAEVKRLGKRMLDEQSLVVYIPHADFMAIKDSLRDVLAQLPDKVLIKDADTFWTEPARITDMTLDTILANSRFFDSLDEVPLRAYTLTGLLLQAKRIVHIAFKDEMIGVLRKMVLGPLTKTNPFSIIIRQTGRYEAIFTKNIVDAIKNNNRAQYPRAVVVESVVQKVLRDHLGIIPRKRKVDLPGSDDGLESAFRDAAMRNQPVPRLASTHKNPTDGGIDLNQISVNRTGKMINVYFDPAQLNGSMRDDFGGFTPMITGFQYIKDVRPLLGVV